MDKGKRRQGIVLKGVKKFFQYCWKLQKSYILLLLVGEICQVIIVICGIIFPKYIINMLFEEQQIPKTILFIILFLISLLLCNFGQALSRYFAEKSRDQMYCKFSISYAGHILDGDYQNMENPEYMDLKEKALKCMNSYGFAGIIFLSASLVGKVLLVLSTAIVVITLDIWILLLFFCLILINIRINNYIERKNAKLGLEEVLEKRKEEYIYQLGNEVQFGKEIRVYGLCNWALKQYREQFQAVHSFTKRKNSNTCITGIVGSFVLFFQQCIIYGYLVYQVFQERLSIGAFTMYLSAVFTFYMAVTEMFKIIGKLQQPAIYFKSFEEFINYPKREAPKTKECGSALLTRMEYSIRFEHVWFCYPGQEKYTLEDISFEVKPGEHIAIIGDNGAGKSTMVKLLTRLYIPDKGKILLNGRDIWSFSLEEYRKIFAVVLQDFQLFAMTIRENIALAESGAIEESKLKQAAEAVGLMDKINSLNKGFDTPLFKVFDEGGIELSGGEAQKVALARALIKNGKIMVLDEPTAALDPRAEYRMYQDFSKLMDGKTSIFISHRLASCQICDRILVLQHGKIVESGTHKQLLAAGGYYAKLFQIQSSWYQGEVG